MLRSPRLKAALIGSLASVLVLISLANLQVLQKFERVVMDQMTSWRGKVDRPPKEEDPILIVAIDEETLEQYRRTSKGREILERHHDLYRSLLADLVLGLRRKCAGVIALDLTFTQPKAGDDELARALRKTDNVVLGFEFCDKPACADPDTLRDALKILDKSTIACWLDRWPDILSTGSIRPNASMLADAVTSQGFVHQPPGARQARLVRRFQDKCYPSLSLVAVLRFLDKRTEVGAKHLLTELRTDPAGLVGVNYRGPEGTLRRRSPLKILTESSRDLDKRKGAKTCDPDIKSKIVFVGTTPGDDRSTVFDRMNGFEIHATMADNLLDGNYIRDGNLEGLLSLVALLILGPLVALSIATFERRKTGVCVAVLLLLAWLSLSFISFRSFHIHLQFVAPPLAGVASLLLTSLHQVFSLEAKLKKFREEAEKRLSTPEFQEWVGAPESTLTLVFTEVTDSRFMSALRGGSREIREAHFARVCSVLNEHEGFEIRRQGRWFEAAFRTSANAMDFAVDICEDTEHEKLTTRAGVHMGQATIDRDGIVGDVVKYVEQTANQADETEVWISSLVRQDIDMNKIRPYCERTWITKACKFGGLRHQQVLHRLNSFDLFLYYRSPDRSHVEHIARQLKERGLRPWFDDWEHCSNDRWRQILRDPDRSVGAAAVFIGPGGPPAEVDEFLGEFDKRHPIIPVFLAGAEHQSDLPSSSNIMKEVYLDTDLRPLDRLVRSMSEIVPMKKCKILFLSANPTGTHQLKLAEEIREIDQKIRQAEYRDTLNLESRWAVRPDDLLEALNRHRPHIVHFSGHGSPNDEIIVMDQDGQPKPISKQALQGLFRVRKDNIRLVFLNTCYSKAQAEAIVEVIEGAVGMKQTIGDKAAIIFAAAFYRAIGWGHSVQGAFDEGRVALQLAGISEEDTPELLPHEGVDFSRVFFVQKTD